MKENVSAAPLKR